MNCPKCGAEPFYIGEFLGSYLCETRYTNGELRYVGRECLERQLSAVTAERDATRESHDRLLKIAEELVGGTDEYWAETEGAGIVRMAHDAIEKARGV